MKPLFFFLFLIVNFSYANNYYADLYRQNGIKAVELELSKVLTKTEYWDNYLKNIDVSKGYYESIKYLIVCTKDMKDINIYQNTQHNSMLIFNADVLTGEANGAKEVEGDLKTPIGAYELTKKLTKLDPFYGPLALVTSYPNTFDKSKGKTGSGIWIHGVPKDNERVPFTKGCIALDNNKLENLNDKINFKDSILIIKEKDHLNITKKEISTILSQIFLWKQAWQSNNIDKYLTFYSNEFKRADGTSLKKFAKYKKRIFKKNELKSIQFSKINIIPHPNSLNKNLFKLTLFEKYNTKYYKFIGNKELYIELINDEMKIVVE